MQSNLVFLAAWSALAGALIPVLAANNGALGRAWGAPFHSTLAVVGLSFVTVAIVLAVARPPAPEMDAIRAAPLIAYCGGLIMAFYALSATFVPPQFGVGNFVMCVVVAQLVMATVIDQFGLFGAPVYQVDLKRAAGLVLLGVGAVLVAVK